MLCWGRYKNSQCLVFYNYCGKVYVEIVHNCSKNQLMPIIQGKILENTRIYTDGQKAYDDS